MPESASEHCVADVLRKRYLLALGLIASMTVFGQVVIQRLLHVQVADAAAIGVAGRQQVLSQKLTKTAFAIDEILDHCTKSVHPPDIDCGRLEEYVNELDETLEVWGQAHVGLRRGAAELFLTGTHTPEVVTLYEGVEPHYRAMHAAAASLLAIFETSELGKPDDTATRPYLMAIAAHDTPYIAGMANVVSRLELESSLRVGRLESTSLVLAAAMLTLLLGTALVLFAPAVRTIRTQFAQLRESRSQFELAITDAPFPIMIHAEDGEVIQVNKTWSDLTGYNLDEIPTIRDWTEKAYGERSTEVESYIETLYGLDDGVVEGDYHIRTQRGDQLIWDFSSLPLGILPDGRRSVISMATNVTDTRRSEQSLRRSNRAFQLLSECDALVVRATDEQDLLQDLCDLIVDHGGYRLAWAGLAEQDERKTVRPVAHAGFEEGYLESVNISWADTELGRGPTGTAIRTCLAVVANNIFTNQSFEPWRKTATERGYSSSIALPIVVDERALGALNIYSSEPEAFGAQETQLLSQLADNLAHGINSLRARTGLAVSEEALRLSHKRYQHLVETIPHGIEEIDTSGTITFANAAHCEIHGYPANELVGMNICDFQRDDSEALADYLEFLVREQPAPTPYFSTTRRKNGQFISMQVDWNYLRDTTGKLIGFVSVVTDVSEKKRADKLAEKQRYYLEKSQVLGRIGTWELDIVGNVLHWTGENCRIFGIPLGSVVSYELFLEKVHPDDREYVDREWSAAVAGKPYDIDHRIIVDGKTKWVREKADIDFDEDGVAVSAIGFTQDITERRQANEKLKESEEQFRQIAETIRDVFWVGSPDWNEVHYISPAYEEVWGRTCQSLYDDPKSWLNAIHEDDRPGLQAAVEQAVGEASADRQFSEYRVIRPDGSLRWILARTYPVLDDHEEIIRVVGIAKDITQRKLAEEQLSMAFEAAPSGMLIADRDGNMRFANEQVEVLFGYTCEEIIGQPVEMLIPERFRRRHPELFDSFFTQENPRRRCVSLDLTGRRKDGTEFPVEIGLSRLETPEGSLVISSIVDITERKRAAQEFTTMFDAIPDAVMLADQDRRIVRNNPAVYSMFGYDEDELIGMSTEMLYADANEFRKQGDRRFHNRPGAETGAYQVEYKRKDGSTFWTESRGTTVKNESGVTIGFIGLFRDITDRRRTETALREHTERLLAAQRVAQLGFLDWNLKTDAIVLSEEIYDIFGFRPGETETSPQLIQSAVHPEDMDAVKAGLERAIADTNPYSLDHRIVRPDGTVRWVHAQAKLIRDAGGHAETLLGTVVDITDRKHTEEELREARDKLESRVAERTAELVSTNTSLRQEIVNRERAEESTRLSAAMMTHMAEGVQLTQAKTGEIVYANPRFEQMFGYRPGELNGKPVSILNAPGEQSPEDTAAQIIQCLHETGRWSGEVHNVRKDGMQFWSSAVVSTFEHGKYGKVWVDVHQDITVRKRAEDDLRESERRLRTILDGIFTFVAVFTLDGVLIEANEAPLKAANLQRADVIGKPFWETYWWSYSPDVQQELRDALARAACGEAVRYDVPVRIAENRLLTIDVMFGPLRDSQGKIVQLIGSAVDIDDRKQAEDALRRTQLAVDHSSEAVFGVHKDGRISYVNRSACESLGYSNAELVLLSVPDISPQHPRTTWPAQWTKMKRAGAMVFEAVHRRKNGSVFPVEITTNFHVHGGEEYMWAHVRDITERKRIEEQLRSRESELAHASRLSTIGATVAGLAHELNQPLSAVSTYADACTRMVDFGDEVELLRTLDKLAAQAERAGKIIHRVHRFIRKEPFQKSTVDLNALVRETLALVDPEGVFGGVSIVLELDDAIPPIQADATQIQQVIVNLVRNALESMYLIDNRDHTLTIQSKASPEEIVTITVHDTGTGLEPEAAERLFEAFYTTKASGMGLGLSVSRTIIEAHNGRLWATPNADAGTTFYMSLPTG